MEAREYRYTAPYKKMVWMGVQHLPVLEEDILGTTVNVEILEDPFVWSLEGTRDAEWWDQFIEEDSL